MRKSIAILLLLVLTAISAATLTTPYSDVPMLTYREQVTRQLSPQLIHSVTADDTLLASTTKYWNNIKSSTQPSFFPVPPSWNRVELSFYCYGDGSGVGDPNKATFSFRVYGCRLYGGAKTIYQGTGICGEQELSNSPITGTSFRTSGVADPNNKWVDTLAPAGVGDVWISDVILSGTSGSDATGEVATLSFDLNGYYGLWVAITDMTAQPATTIYAIATGY